MNKSTMIEKILEDIMSMPLEALLEYVEASEFERLSKMSAEQVALEYQNMVEEG